MRSFWLTGLRRLKMHKSLAKRKIPMVSKSGKIATGTARRGEKGKDNEKQCSFGSAKSDRKCLKLFFRNVLPTEGGEHFFARNGHKTDQQSTQSGSDRLKTDTKRTKNQPKLDQTGLNRTGSGQIRVRSDLWRVHVPR